jgi:hypothetical protein
MICTLLYLHIPYLHVIMMVRICLIRCVRNRQCQWRVDLNGNAIYQAESGGEGGEAT